MRLRVGNQTRFFYIVVVAVVLAGLAAALLIGNRFEYPPALTRFYLNPAFDRDLVIPASGQVSRADAVTLLARLIQAEAANEPYHGKVAVGAVVLNRVRNPSFPNTIPGVIFQPRAFEPVANGRIWLPVHQDSYRAARHALAGWDPTHGSLYFWNPATSRSPWIWTRTIITRIGRHLFGR